MKRHYITIAGRELRIEFNWNAIISFLAETGNDTMEGLNALSKMKPSEIISLAHAAITEGERIEGRKFELSKEQLGEALNTAAVREIIEIFVAQNHSGKGESGQENEGAPAKKKSLFQRSVKSGE